MNEIRKPYFWSRMGFTARAGYLCSSGQARSYAEACSILARLPRKRKPMAPKDPAVYRWDLRD